jgi:hypothetical protein
MSEDPIIFNAGDENTRRYVHNASLNFVDSNGMFQDPPFLQAIAALLFLTPVVRPKPLPSELQLIAMSSVGAVRRLPDPLTLSRDWVLFRSGIPNEQGPCYLMAHSMARNLSNAINIGKLPETTKIEWIQYKIDPVKASELAKRDVKDESHIIISVTLPDYGTYLFDGGSYFSDFSNIGNSLTGLIGPAQIKALVTQGVLTEMGRGVVVPSPLVIPKTFPN